LHGFQVDFAYLLLSIKPVQVCEILPPHTRSVYVRFVCVIPVHFRETGHHGFCSDKLGHAEGTLSSFKRQSILDIFLLNKGHLIQ
jgi:hypothetical protein